MGSGSPAHISGLSVWVLRGGVLVALLVGGYLVFELGRLQAGYSIVDTAATHRAYRAEVSDLEGQIVSLKEQIALLETHRDVDRHAYEAVEGGLA